MIVKIIYKLLLIIACVVASTACSSRAGVPGSNEDKAGFFDAIFSGAKDSKTLKLKPKEYITYCENTEHGLIANKEIGDFIFSAFYKPVNYMVTQELRDNHNISIATFQAKQDEYGDMSYFSFKIQNTKQENELLKINLGSENEYYSRLEYMSFKMQQDFKLIQGRDTLDCQLYHFERIYGLAPYATFVLAFPKIDPRQEIKFWYHDKIFNTGIIMMTFEREAITNLPTLDI